MNVALYNHRLAEPRILFKWDKSMGAMDSIVINWTHGLNDYFEWAKTIGAKKIIVIPKSPSLNDSFE